MIIELIGGAEWGPQHWLAVSILAFIIVTSIVILWRLMGLLRLFGAAPREPNLRPLRGIRGGLRR